jgi:energy-converting hydrogenase Eha subunit G
MRLVTYLYGFTGSENAGAGISSKLGFYLSVRQHATHFYGEIEAEYSINIVHWGNWALRKACYIQFQQYSQYQNLMHLQVRG